MLKFGMSGIMVGATLAFLGACATEDDGDVDTAGAIALGQDGVPALSEMQEVTAPGEDGAGLRSWSDCPSGFSCYFVHANGGNPMWKAPSAGWFHLGNAWRDKISSIRNRGGGRIDLYNCVDHPCSSANYMTSVHVGQQVNLAPAYNDKVDIIRILD